MTAPDGTSLATADLAAAADGNLRAASRAFALACATGAAWEGDGVSVASSGNGLRSFNVAFITRCEREPLRRACDFLAGRVARFRVRIRQDIAVDDRVIDAAGLQLQGGIPSLALAPVPTGGAAGALDIRPVAGARTLRDHVEVLAAGFGWQPALPAQVFTERLLAVPAWRGYTGYAGDRPVASSQLYLHKGVAGIYYVATVEGQRGRGFGEAMTRHALVEGAAAGCDLAGLQASPMGLPIYLRMGFQQVSYYRQYIPKEA